MPKESSASPPPPVEGQNAGKEDDPTSETTLAVHYQALHTIWGKTTWLVPIAPDEAVPCLIRGSTALAEKGEDTANEWCVKFYENAISRCFHRLTEEPAILTWIGDVLKNIYLVGRDLMELLVLKFDSEFTGIFDSAQCILNSDCVFHRTPNQDPDSELVSPYARPMKQTYLAELIHYFGKLGGFDKLKEWSLTDITTLTFKSLVCYLKLLSVLPPSVTTDVAETCMHPCVVKCFSYVDAMSEADLKTICRTETTSELMCYVIKMLRSAASYFPDMQAERFEWLENQQLRIYKITFEEGPFNSRMAALKLINWCSDRRHDQNRPSGEGGWLLSDRIVKWVIDQDILSLVLRENLHQFQYAEKVESLIQCLLSRSILTTHHLDAIWHSQIEKHDAIVKNVHGFLCRLAWRFNTQQLDHLFTCFEKTGRTASKKNQELLLRLMSSLAEDDKQGGVAAKVLNVQWSLAFDPNTPPDIAQHAISGLVRILSYTSSNDGYQVKMKWIIKCFRQLGSVAWSMRALCVMLEILRTMEQRSPPGRRGTERDQAINKLVEDFAILDTLCDNLAAYCAEAHAHLPEGQAVLSAGSFRLDSMHNHSEQIQKRLDLARYIVREGGLYLDDKHVMAVWNSLVANSVFPSDADHCLQWLTQLAIPREPDIMTCVANLLMKNCLMHLDPATLSEVGFKCFDTYYRLVNRTDEKWRFVDILESAGEKRQPIGWDYLWQLLECGKDVVTERTIATMRDSVVQPDVVERDLAVEVRASFLETCVCRLESVCPELMSSLSSSPVHQANSSRRSTGARRSGDPTIVNGNGHPPATANSAVKPCTRILKLIVSYIEKLDSKFCKLRGHLPHTLAARGGDVTLSLNYHMNYNRPPDEDFGVHRHNSVADIRRLVRARWKKHGLPGEPSLVYHHAAPPHQAVSPSATLLRKSEDYRLVGTLGGRDRMMLSLQAPCQTDSPVTPSSSAGGHPSTHDTEENLPGIRLSKRPQFYTMLLNILDSSTHHGCTKLTQSCLDLLDLLPTDPNRLRQFRECLQEESTAAEQERSHWTNGMSSILRSWLVDTSPAKAMYNLEVLEVLLLPTIDAEAADGLASSADTLACQVSFVKAGGLASLTTLLRAESLLRKACPVIKRRTFQVALRLCKVFLAAVAHARLHHAKSSMQENLLKLGKGCIGDMVLRSPEAQRMVRDSGLSTAQFETACRLKLACDKPPHQQQDYHLWKVARDVGCLCHEVLGKFSPSLQLLECVRQSTSVAALGHDTKSSPVLNSTTSDLVETSKADLVETSKSDLAETSNASHPVRHAVTFDSPPKIRNFNGEFSSSEKSEDSEPDLRDSAIAIHGLQVLAWLASIIPTVVDYQITNNEKWLCFVNDLLLGVDNSDLRVGAANTFFHMLTTGLLGKGTIFRVVDYFFDILTDLSKKPGDGYPQFFRLFCRLISNERVDACSGKLKERLASLIAWLDHIQNMVLRGTSSPATDSLLTGYLNVINQLVKLLKPEDKEDIGVGHVSLIHKLLQDFLFPSSNSNATAEPRRERRPSRESSSTAVCKSASTRAAAFQVLVELCSQCVKNVYATCGSIRQLFYAGIDMKTLNEWEYAPNVSYRPPLGFIGLRNAGATCYMNAVLQTLFMIPPIRNAILSAHSAGWDEADDALAKAEKESSIGSPSSLLSHLDLCASPTHPAIVSMVTESENPEGDMSTQGSQDTPYNVTILRHVQHTFGHLLLSRTPFYSPVSFWKVFRLNGLPVHLREQFDALEFMSILTDTVDEAMHSLQQPKAFEDVLRGTFADQKNCKTCPHRYSRSEPFSSIAVDIQNCNNLAKSLADYVKGDLLEGDNKYHCEKCNEKVDAVKRLCIDKLPQVLTIQLKRFNYDWERECAIKFNDYFEFPREIDMYPYTARGLEDAEGQDVAMDCSESTGQPTCLYSLSAVVVHVGSASAGHYYSFVRQKDQDGSDRWYKFDDMDVTECHMLDKDMKDVFFGGDLSSANNTYHGHNTRRPKRSNSAYLLFYEQKESPVFAHSTSTPPLPQHVTQAVHQGNLLHTHQRSHFSTEYFGFLCNLLASCVPHSNEPYTDKEDEIVLEVMKLVCTFLFAIGLRCTKSLRGNVEQWFEGLKSILSRSAKARLWFYRDMLFKHPELFRDYLLDCPHAEVRRQFASLLAQLCHLSFSDGHLPCPEPEWAATHQGRELLEALNKLVDDNNILLVYVVRFMELIAAKITTQTNGRPLYQFYKVFTGYVDCASACATNEHSVRSVCNLAYLGVPAMVAGLLVSDYDARPVSPVEAAPIHLLLARMLLYFQIPNSVLRVCTEQATKDGSIPTLKDNPYDEKSPQWGVFDFSSYLSQSIFKGKYIEKLLEVAPCELPTRRLLCKLSWENPNMSHTILTGLMSLVRNTRHDAHTHAAITETICQVLNIADSWQTPRISLAVFGNDQKNGLVSLFKCQRSFLSDRRATLRMAKTCVQILSRCPAVVHDVQKEREWLFAYNAIAAFLDETLRLPPKSYVCVENSSIVTSSDLANAKEEVKRLARLCTQLLQDSEYWDEAQRTGGVVVQQHQEEHEEKEGEEEEEDASMEVGAAPTAATDQSNVEDDDEDTDNDDEEEDTNKSDDVIDDVIDDDDDDLVDVDDDADEAQVDVNRS